MRVRIGLLGILCGAASIFAIAATPAGALMTRSLEEGFGPDGMASSSFPSGAYPWSLVVDQSNGELYVASLDGAVRRFSRTHKLEPLSNVGFGLSSISEQGNQLALNSVTHDFYVVGQPFVTPRVRAFNADAEPVDFTAGAGAGTNEVGLEVCGVAVDANGDLYVSEPASGMHVFTASGELLASFPSLGGCNLAVDSQGIVYVATPRGPVEKLKPTEFPVTASTTYVSEGVVDAGEASTVAVDPIDNHLFVDEGSRIVEYGEGATTRLGTFGAEDGLVNSVGLAVDGATDKVYVSNSEGGSRQIEVFGTPFLLPDVITGEATEISPKGTVTLNGTVNPDGVEVTGCRFLYGLSESYGQTVPCEQAVGSGTSAEPVTAKLAGLTPGATYHFRLEASNTAAPTGAVASGSDRTFTMPPKPTISAAGIANLAAHSVDLRVQINPEGLATSCHFEYGPTENYGTSIECKPPNIEGSTDVLVEQHLQSLEENVTYHWRVVVNSEAGTTVGVDHTFVYPTSGEGLPDGRAYEMVTPSQKNGAVIGPALFGLPPDIAEDGSRVMLSSIQCFGHVELCEAKRGRTGTAYFFSRTSVGWVAHTLAPSASQFEGVSGWLVSAEQESELFSVPVPPMFQDDFFIRRGDGPFVDIGSATPPADGNVGLPWEAPSMKATSDFSHVIYQFEPGLWSFDGSLGPSTLELSSRTGGVPVLVGVNGGLGSHDLISECGTELGFIKNGENPGELSEDGGVVFFTAVPCGSGTGANVGVAVPARTLYARIGESRTVKISERSVTGCLTVACRTSAPADASFAGASNDGSRVFFTSDQQLMDSAAVSGNLYEYDFGSPAGENLVDVSAGDTSGSGPNVRGVVAISADGSHVYFVAGGVLNGAANQEGGKAQAGANNLYVFSREAGGAGHVSFIAQLPETDVPQWSGNGNGGLANVTPDGRFLVFESHGLLTRDDTRNDGAVQIFRYDAQTGGLVRLSVGEHGFNDNGNAGIGDAQIVPAERGFIHAGVSRSDPTMSNDGSFVFFESPVGLTPHALDDVLASVYEGQQHYAKNVYEWHDGVVYLISDGRDAHVFGPTSVSTVELLGSDGSGANVFFSTADPLVPQDTDTQLDYYDARICTAGDPCVPRPPVGLPPCLGEACHGIPAGVPGAQVGPTATFNGRGNVSIKPGKKRVKRGVAGCRRGRPRHGHRRCKKRRASGGRRGISGRGGVGR